MFVDRAEVRQAITAVTSQGILAFTSAQKDKGLNNYELTVHASDVTLEGGNDHQYVWSFLISSKLMLT